MLECAVVSITVPWCAAVKIFERQNPNWIDTNRIWIIQIVIIGMAVPLAASKEWERMLLWTKRRWMPSQYFRRIKYSRIIAIPCAHNSFRSIELNVTDDEESLWFFDVSIGCDISISWGSIVMIMNWRSIYLLFISESKSIVCQSQSKDTFIKCKCLECCPSHRVQAANRAAPDSQHQFPSDYSSSRRMGFSFK